MDLLYKFDQKLEGGLGVILVMISHAVFVLKCWAATRWISRIHDFFVSWSYYTKKAWRSAAPRRYDEQLQNHFLIMDLQEKQKQCRWFLSHVERERGREREREWGMWNKICPKQCSEQYEVISSQTVRAVVIRKGVRNEFEVVSKHMNWFQVVKMKNQCGR
jgi:hypothetical protein